MAMHIDPEQLVCFAVHLDTASGRHFRRNWQWSVSPTNPLVLLKCCCFGEIQVEQMVKSPRHLPDGD
jgi:hypothetical protein